MVSDVEMEKNNDFLDLLLKKLSAKNDAALAKILGRRPPEISRIRSGRLNIPPSMLIIIHEKADMSFTEIRARLSVNAPSKSA